MTFQGLCQHFRSSYLQERHWGAWGWGWGWGGGEHKGFSFCGTPAKNLKKLRPAASKVMILWLRHHQDSQVAFYIDNKL